VSSAVQVEDVTKNYTTSVRKGLLRREKRVVKALKGVSFTVSYGEVFGLLGPNGAGKTTTIKILATLLIPDSGKATVCGYDVVEDPEMVRDSIGVTLTVEKGFFWKLTGRENLKYFGMLRGLSGKKLNERVNDLLETLGLNKLGASDRFYEEYSLGMKARLCLARALLTDPPILMLDEPTLGLDPPSAREIRNLLVMLARNGKAVLVTTHNMFEAELICDRVAIIDEGRIISIGPVQELKRRVADKIAVDILVSNPAIGLEIMRKRLRTVIETVGVGVDERGGVYVRFTCRSGEEDKMIADVIKSLGDLKVRIYRVNVEEPTLEDVFISLTGKAGEA